jgi:hypothetical protein
MTNYQKYFSGWALLLVAVVAFSLLAVELTVLTLLVLIWRRQWKGIAKYFNRLAKMVAVLIDITANVAFFPLWNKILIRDTFGADKYNFGKIETLSKVLGINKQRGTLTKAGWIVADFLNFLDENHVEKAAGLI